MIWGSLIQAAIGAAKDSACRRSKRGVVLFDIRIREPLATGSNFLPGGSDCNEVCVRSKKCGKFAIHAEQDALSGLLHNPQWANDPGFISGLHVKVDSDGNLVTSGGPSCVECSKQMYAFGMESFWLYHDEGFRVEGDDGVSHLWLEGYEGVFACYPIKLFHELSLRANRLPVL